jgi:hypothetical protein
LVPGPPIGYYFAVAKPALGRLVAGVAMIAAAAGCASVAPKSESVVLTHESSEVAGCKEIGSVQSWLSLTFKDAQTQLRNRAAGLGADTVLVSSSFGDTNGTAYLCAGRK